MIAIGGLQSCVLPSDAPQLGRLLIFESTRHGNVALFANTLKCQKMQRTEMALRITARQRQDTAVAP